MLSRVVTFALDGLEARPVWVEVDIRPGLPAFHVVGLGDKAVREARERVRSAIANQGFEFPQRRITANLAPAYLRKAGASFDLPLALGVLAASGQLPPAALEAAAIFGELSLGGEVRGSRGTLAVAEAAVAAGTTTLVLARGRAREAALVEGVFVAGVTTLREAVAALAGGEVPPLPPAPAPPDDPEAADLSDIRGQELAVHALVIAAAGGHNLLFQGPPGTGKTMLARRLPGILPPLSRSEAIEVTRVQSVAGLHAGGDLVARRPFRAPHHATSAAGLVGGGPAPSPGEATLAHLGVLFLDELPEFPRPSLEALRQPLEDGHVTVVRGQHALRFPTRFQLVAAANPCPCGHAGTRACRCSETDHRRYERRLSGPLLDRIDLLVPVHRPVGSTGATTTAEARDEVLAARERQAGRAPVSGAEANAGVEGAVLRRLGHVTSAAHALLDGAYAEGRLSARGRDRTLRVALTIADLRGGARVEPEDVAQALQLRQGAAEPALAA